MHNTEKERRNLPSFSTPLTMDECERKFQNGIPNTQSPRDFIIAVHKPSANCTFEVDGKYAFVAAPGKAIDTINFIHEIPVLTKEEFEGAENGTYAWVICKIAGEEDEPPKFFARKVRSILEVGSLHKAIVRGILAATIHGAGEARKEGSTITFNFLSGSYMQIDCDKDARETFLKEHLASDEMFGKKAKFPKDMLQTFITEKPTMEELQDYADKGFRICLHDTKEECESVKHNCENRMKPRGSVKGGMQASENSAFKRVNPGSTSQAEKARLVFASQGLISKEKLRPGKEQAVGTLAEQGRISPIQPSSVGLGRKRKTRRGKAKRRMTKKKW